ncbi:MAG: tRNA (guanosine(18)-2'-O)-methyltransferase TrmH [Motiliproteus sp.]
MTPERLAKFERVLDRRQTDLTLIADQVNKSQNLSALIRTADAVGMLEVHAVVPEEGYRDFNRTAKGSGQWLEVRSHENFQQAADAVRGKGMTIVAAHFSGSAVDYRELDYTQPIALLLGAEKRGVSQHGADQADQHILVPMMGMVSSLNVSVAAGIILAEAQRQRTQAGLYDKSRLDPELRRDILFRWCHRRLADYCHLHQLQYPPVDEALNLVEPSAWYEAVRGERAAKRTFA